MARLFVLLPSWNGIVRMDDENVVNRGEYPVSETVIEGAVGTNLPPRESHAMEVVPGLGSQSTYGKYVTSDDAYRVYIAMGSRSLRKTAVMMGIPEGTVGSWSRREGWRQRVVDMDTELTEGVIHASAVAVVSQQLRTIEKLAMIRDNEKSQDRDIINAAKLLMEAYERIRLTATVTALLGGNEGDMEADELERLVSTPGGAQVLLGRLRDRTGRG